MHNWSANDFKKIPKILLFLWNSVIFPGFPGSVLKFQTSRDVHMCGTLPRTQLKSWQLSLKQKQVSPRIPPQNWNHSCVTYFSSTRQIRLAFESGTLNTIPSFGFNCFVCCRAWCWRREHGVPIPTQRNNTCCLPKAQASISQNSSTIALIFAGYKQWYPSGSDTQSWFENLEKNYDILQRENEQKERISERLLPIFGESWNLHDEHFLFLHQAFDSTQMRCRGENHFNAFLPRTSCRQGTTNKGQTGILQFGINFTHSRILHSFGLNKYPAILFVRNPYTRLVSAFHDKLNPGEFSSFITNFQPLLQKLE